MFSARRANHAPAAAIWDRTWSCGQSVKLVKVRIFKRSSNFAGRVGLTGGRCKTPQRLLLLTGLVLPPTLFFLSFSFRL